MLLLVPEAQPMHPYTVLSHCAMREGVMEITRATRKLVFMQLGFMETYLLGSAHWQTCERIHICTCVVVYGRHLWRRTKSSAE